MMMMKKIWMKPGVFNVEELDPVPFLEVLSKMGLPWDVAELPAMPPVLA
jgi:saccharopine dehydrogenase (NAD+, L-lysine-forming)